MDVQTVGGNNLHFDRHICDYLSLDISFHYIPFNEA